MSTRVSTGEAFIDGQYVADVELREEWIAEAVAVALPGTNRTDYKDLSHPGPAYVQFEWVSDPDLRSRLERLIEFASAHVDRQRAIRDAGQRSIAVDLAIDGGPNIIRTRVDPPLVGHTTVEATVFPVSLPE
jgi:hypothetical protein